MGEKATMVLCLMWMMNTTHTIVSGVNIALGKKTRQSTTYSTYRSEKAVNGDWTEYDANNQYLCTHTTCGYQDWWVVDLGDIYNITNVIIHNRQLENCYPWLNNYDIDVFDKPACFSDKWVTFSRGRKSKCHFQESSVLLLNATCKEESIGRFVRIQFRNAGCLCLCEVEVYGMFMTVSNGVSSARKACGFPNKEYTGIDLATTKARSGIECANVCLKTDSCCSGVYQNAMNLCTLKRKSDTDENTSHSFVDNPYKTSWWILFQDNNHEGHIFVCKEGEKIPKVSFMSFFNNKASSLKLVDDFDFSEAPRCTVYQFDNFKGRSLTFDSDVEDLSDYKFDNKVSSIDVNSGAWVGYQFKNFTGKQWYLPSGKYKEADGNFKDDAISSMRAIQIVQNDPVIVEKIEFKLDKAVVQSTPRAVFTWTQVNNSSVDQRCTLNNEETITMSDTYQFTWDQGTKISASMETSLKLPVIEIGADLSLSTEMSLDIGVTKGSGKTNTHKWRMDIPSIVPARSQITLTASITEGKMEVPFVAVFSQGHRSWTELGKFNGVQFYTFAQSLGNIL